MNVVVPGGSTGHAAGQHGLAYMHTHGRGAVSQDAGEAFRLHMLAAKQGFAAALKQVGIVSRIQNFVGTLQL